MLLGNINKLRYLLYLLHSNVLMVKEGFGSGKFKHQEMIECDLVESILPYIYPKDIKLHI